MCNSIVITNNLQVLTFLKSIKLDSFAILVPQLVKQLKKKGSEITNLQRAMEIIFGESLVKGKQHAFLKPGSQLSAIPCGRSARKHPQVVYARCVILAKSALSKETCRLLEQGNFTEL